MAISPNSPTTSNPNYQLTNKKRLPGPTRASAPLDISSATRSIYDGRDRLGSYRRVVDRWLAVDRLGRPLGQFDTELQAQDAISKAVRA